MDVVFAVLPFADVERPAIGVSLLKAEIEALGFSASISYFNIKLAELIGNELYLQISETLPSESLIGDWFFADMLFDDLPDPQEYSQKILSKFAPQEQIDLILKARQVREDYLDHCARELYALKPRVIGFTTTFHQTCVCLAVAKRVKDMPDPPLIAFGGANCEGEMGLQLLRSFPWIDYVCTREGDVAFPSFIKGLLGENSAELPSGILQQGVSKELTLPDLIHNLNDLPIPDFRDYFEAFKASPLSETIKPELLIETSRGCWWGAKSHCTFCGLNGETMSFRSKTPERALSEMRYLSETYGVKKMSCVDNILDLRYIPTLFPKLAESGLDLELFYEIKSNMDYEQIEALSKGGVIAVQPGIESLSNDVLRLMKKGCTGLQNIQLLKWCLEHNIYVAWNMLAGFPEEEPSEYDKMARLLPLLQHLQPPTSCFPIRLDRFSPLFTRTEEFGLERVRPNPAYYYVYPLGRRELEKLAYFFDFDFPDKRNPHEYLVEIKKGVTDWRVAWYKEPENRARLDAYWTDRGTARIVDTRDCASAPEQELTGFRARLFFACDAAQSVNSLQRIFPAVDEAELLEALEDLQALKIMTEMEGQYLSLAVLRERPAPVRKKSIYVDKQGVQAPSARSLPVLVPAA
jgi:ribosomal peptide maturation radical SAM protein 1